MFTFKNCIIALNETEEFILVCLGQMEEMHMAIEYPMSDIFGDNYELGEYSYLNTIDGENITKGVYIADIIVMPCKSSYESIYDDDMDINVKNIRPLKIMQNGR